MPEPVIDEGKYEKKFHQVAPGIYFAGPDRFDLPPEELERQAQELAAILFPEERKKESRVISWIKKLF